MKRKGGCFCGAVRYELLTEPMFVHCCHCTDCQNQTGSAFAINAITEARNFKKIKGTVKPVPMSPRGKRPHDIYRCRKCDVALWSDYGRRRSMLFLRVSTLDKPHGIKPDVHIFTRSKVPWVKLPKSAKTFKVYYDMAKEWPRKSLKRRAALLGTGK